MVILGFAGWLVIGLIVGFIGTKVVNLRGDDPRFSMAAAAIAALVGGLIYTFFSGVGIGGFHLRAVIVAACAALATVIVWHLVRSRFISHDGYVPRQSY